MSRNILRLAVKYFYPAILSLPILACTPSPAPKPMDVQNPKWEFDYNLFSVNPNWSYMLANGTPPDPTKLCPVDSDDPATWQTSSRSCTNQDIYKNQATGWNQFDCWLHGRAIQAHMNWFPVTYEGWLYWDSHSPPGGDDDYNFGMFRDDKALYTAGLDVIHTEFDSDETVDNWDGTNTWWEHFHDAVDNDNDNAHAMLHGNYAVVIALLGLDGGHADFKAELHPVYGMFIHVKDDPADDQWAFFIRNWGDEGSCSNSQEYIERTSLFVELPNESAQYVELATSNVWGVNFEDQTRMKVSFQKSARGVLFAFAFDNPRKKESYVGDLHVRWSGNNLKSRNDFNPKAAALSHSSSASDSEGAPKALVDKFNKLTPVSKRQLRRELRALNALEPSRAAIVPTRDMTSFDIAKINKQIAEIKRERKMPNYSSLIVSEADPSIFVQKRRKLDLVTRFLNEHRQSLESR